MEINANPAIHYSDKESAKMVKWRRLNLLIGSILFPVYTLLLIYGVWGRAIGRGYVKSTWTAILWAIVTVAFVLLLYYFFVEVERRAWKFGIILNENALSVFGKEISLQSIISTEIVLVKRIKRYLAIGYIVQKRDRKKVRVSRVWEFETDDVFDLCTKIRELKGLPKKTQMPMTTWRDWKASLRGSR